MATFETEAPLDKLTVNGATYSGTTGPAGVTVAAGMPITWIADGSGSRQGFEICATASGGQSGKFYTPRTCKMLIRQQPERGQLATHKCADEMPRVALLSCECPERVLSASVPSAEA